MGLLKKYKSLYSSTTNSFGTGTGETITPASVTGLPTDTEITLTFDRVDSSGTATPTKMERIIGTISGGNFVITTRGADGSTEQAHTSPVVEMVWNAKDWNDAIDAFLVNHTQAGAHASSIVTLSGSQTLSNKTFSDDIFLANGKNIQYNSADPYRTIWAGSWQPTTTAGCASPTVYEFGTNDVDMSFIDFDKATDEHAWIDWCMPSSWNGGTLLFRVIWTAAAGGAADTVNFVLKGRAYADGDAIDQAQGTGVAVTDTWQADGDLHYTPWSTAVTLAGSPAGGQMVHLDLMRDISEDDLDCDARVRGVQLVYVQSTFGD